MNRIPTRQLDEQRFTHRPTRFAPLASAVPMVPSWVSAPVPAWSSMKLHRRFWAEGDALEICLETEGEPASRGLVARDGQFLFGPTGPGWARELVLEFAEEWHNDSLA